MTDRDRALAALTGAPTPAPALVLAPMATLTHAGFRILVEEYGGCDLYFSEMISAEALIGRTQYEPYYLMDEPDPGRLIFQLVGYSEDRLCEAALELSRTAAIGIDVNMGCSAPHIVRKGGGIAWMTDTERSVRLVERLRKLAPQKSLSVKLRLGSEDDPEALLAFARNLESAGVDFVTLHPKRRREGSLRTARWSFVALLREHLKIPVIGNGGVKDWTTLQSRLSQAGSGPVMIGRAAVRAPWIFSHLRREAAGQAGEYRINLRETAQRFFALLEEYQPRDFWPTRARRFVPYLLENVKFGHSIAARLAQMNPYDQLRRELFAYFDEHPHAEQHIESG